jgi:hypothetical protein
MSNPVVTFSNSIPVPGDPSTVRKTYSQKVFDSVAFFLYADGEEASSYSPTDMGMEFYLIYQLGDVLGLDVSSPPDFIVEPSWPGIRAAPSAFVTPNLSTMPKILTPSTLMVDNGLDTSGEKSAAYWDGTNKLFNWVIDSFNGDPVDDDEVYLYARISPGKGNQFVSVTAKDDSLEENILVMSLDKPESPPSGDWDSTDMVAGGAFMLMLNIIGVTPGQVAPETTDANKWQIEIAFGEVTMTLADASTMKVKIGGEEIETTVNLAEGAAKSGQSQSEGIPEKAPLTIGVYPCWNGIIVTSGTQETPQVVDTASTFCRRLRAAAIQNSDYSDWFDPMNPEDIKVGTGSGSKNVLVDMGDKITVTAKNCRFEIAYSPTFFSRKMAYDGWLLLADDTAEITYEYNVYTIYTENGTDYSVKLPTVQNSGTSGTYEDTSFYYIPWEMEADNYKRWAGEIFAYILETVENRTYSIKNGNGSFNLSWSGGTPGDTDTDWKTHIKSVSVTMGIDGSSGQIMVDKYGCAGQDAVATQSIGAVVLSATGGKDTVSGDIFYGLGMGISNNDQSNDATWTIPLIGLEKKLDDIALINPPFVDGWNLVDAVDYLCRYAGLNYNMANANGSIALSATEEINSVRFDWKSGTTVKSALEEILQDVLHWYCVRDGMVYIYELGDNGLPVSLGPNRSGGYNSQNIVNRDQTPDFEDLRNYIVAMALQQVPEGTGTKINGVPTFPMLESRLNATTPDVPWAKCWVRAVPGALEPDKLSSIADRMAKMSTIYEMTGSLTIPGNASIKPYDQWDDNVIYSVTHTVDLEGKTWTTSLEFMKSAT